MNTLAWSGTVFATFGREALQGGCVLTKKQGRISPLLNVCRFAGASIARLRLLSLALPCASSAAACQSLLPSCKCAQTPGAELRRRPLGASAVAVAAVRQRHLYQLGRRQRKKREEKAGRRARADNNKIGGD